MTTTPRDDGGPDGDVDVIVYHPQVLNPQDRSVSLEHWAVFLGLEWIAQYPSEAEAFARARQLAVERQRPAWLSHGDMSEPLPTDR